MFVASGELSANASKVEDNVNHVLNKTKNKNRSIVIWLCKSTAVGNEIRDYIDNILALLCKGNGFAPITKI